MNLTTIFDNEVQSFDRPFTYEELKAKISLYKEFNNKEYYIKSCLKDRIKKEYISFDNGFYKLIKAINTKKAKKNKPHPISESVYKKDKKIVRINKNLTNKESLQFFYYTLIKFLKLCNKRGINDVKKYLHSTDKEYLRDDTITNDTCFIFKEFAYHATNRGNFPFEFKKNNNENGIKSFTKEFSANAFSSYADTKTEDELRNELKQCVSGKDDDEGYLNYVKCLKSVSKFLKDKNRKQIIDELNNPSKVVSEKDLQNLFINFKNKIEYGFGDTLFFDILKELDNKVFDYPKPDLHVRRALLFLLSDDIVENDVNFYSLIDEMRSINAFKATYICMNIADAAQEKYKKLKGNGKISRYFLDKMIYIIGSGKFYLNNVKDSSLKKEYLRGLVTKEYKNIRIGKNELLKIKEIINQ